MARVLVLTPDLMFGSRVQAALAGAGHAVELLGDPDVARARAPDADVLVVDLVSDDIDGAAVVAAGVGGTPTLGYYSHVDTAARERAEQAGFDQVVPRSRMAREGPELVARLAGRS
jgi:DNA-binding response OmpR family regulator